ncbi:hypothetical protein LEP1GSC192_1161 [Leptospira sp. B5-022]|nr:hypothetical protein LEP1GSC192_1161 [Leptospira sp. B5-022]
MSGKQVTKKMRKNNNRNIISAKYNLNLKKQGFFLMKNCEKSK